jgi:hypothetical protein
MDDELKLEFGLDYFQILEQDEDCMIVSLDLLHLGENRNKCNISKECADKSLPTIFNKPIIYRLDNKYYPQNSTDVVEHARNNEEEKLMYIAGTIPESSPIEYVERDNKTYLRVNGVIHKSYQPILAQILKKRNGKVKVSIEIKAKGHMNENGIFVIEEFIFKGVCLLAKDVMEGIEGSQMVVTKFSIDDFNMHYLNFSNKTIKKDEENECQEIISSETFVATDELDSTSESTCNNEEIKNAKKEVENLEENKTEEIINIAETEEEVNNTETVETEVEVANTTETVSEEVNEEVENTIVNTEDWEKKYSEVEEKCSIMEQKCSEMEQKYNAMETELTECKNKLMAYERVDEETKMSAYVKEFAHCMNEDEMKQLNESISKFTFNEFKKEVDKKAIEYARTKKEETVQEEEVKNSYEVSFSNFGLSDHYNYETKNKPNDLETISKNSGVKIKIN